MFILTLFTFYYFQSQLKSLKIKSLFSNKKESIQNLTNIKPNTFYSLIQWNPQFQTSNLLFVKPFQNPKKTQIYKYQKFSPWNHSQTQTNPLFQTSNPHTYLQTSSHAFMRGAQIFNGWESFGGVELQWRRELRGSIASTEERALQESESMLLWIERVKEGEWK